MPNEATLRLHLDDFVLAVGFELLNRLADIGFCIVSEHRDQVIEDALRPEVV